jgi:hypothetical protein
MAAAACATRAHANGQLGLAAYVKKLPPRGRREGGLSFCSKSLVHSTRLHRDVSQKLDRPKGNQPRSPHAPNPPGLHAKITPSPRPTPTSPPPAPLSSTDFQRTFTACGATGPTGPVPAACATAYAGTPLASEASVFPPVDPKAGQQQWAVPFSGNFRITACM